MFEILNNDNFVLYAAKNYDNPHCGGSDEFFADIKRFKYLKRLFGKYERSGILQERLILNHIVVLYNMFGDSTTRMLFFKLQGYHHYLKPFLILLNRLPDVIDINETNKIRTANIDLDTQIITALRNLQ